MGVAILDENGWHIESDDSTESAKKGWDRSQPEMGERRREEDSRSRLPFGSAVTPGLMEVPVTPAIEKREKWHPGLSKTPITPVPREKKPVFH